MARRALGRLTDWRVLDRLPRAIGGVRSGSEGFAYHLGPVGLRLLKRKGFQSKQLGAPGDRYVRHTLAITEAMVGLHEASVAGELDVIEAQTEPSCWRPFIGAMGARVTLKPDLFVRVGVGALEDRWFIEIDLATEARGTLVSKAKRYLAYYRSSSEQRAHGVFPRVLWVVPTPRRAAQLWSALEALPVEAQPLFEVCLAGDLIERLAAEAQL